MENNDKSFLMRLADITILTKHFNFRNPELFKIVEPHLHEFVFDFNVSISATTQPPFVSIIAGIKVFTEAAKTNEFGFFEIGVSFEVPNLNEFVIEDKIMIPDQILYTMVTTTIGTTRGTLFSELKSSPFPNIYLPLIEIKPLVDNLRLKIKDGLVLTPPLEIK